MSEVGKPCPHCKYMSYHADDCSVPLTDELAAMRAEVERLKGVLGQTTDLAELHQLIAEAAERERDALRAQVAALQQLIAGRSVGPDHSVASNEMVERVARAIYEATYPGHPGLPNSPFSALDEENQENYRRRARAAIGAMGETP